MAPLNCELRRGPCKALTHSLLPLLQIVRKERAVGAIPEVPTVYEVLEEMAITVQSHLVDSQCPFCAFNGGADVFVDVRFIPLHILVNQ